MRAGPSEFPCNGSEPVICCWENFGLRTESEGIQCWRPTNGPSLPAATGGVTGLQRKANNYRSTSLSRGDIADTLGPTRRAETIGRLSHTDPRSTLASIGPTPAGVVALLAIASQVVLVR